MRIKSVQCSNFKGYKSLNINLSGKSAIIFGINGTGKTTLLSIINYVFWRCLNPLNPSQGTAYKSFEPGLVRNGSSQLLVQTEIEANGKEYALFRTYYKARAGKNAYASYNKSEYDGFVSDFVSEYLRDDDSNMPIFVSYGINRAVLDIPLRIRQRHQFSKIAAIEHCSDNKIDFRTFFEWYRNQEDLENEYIREKNDNSYEDRCLKCVRTAVGAMLGSFSGIRVKRNPLRMVVQKNNIEIQVDQLSDGEKCTLALFGDLARRIAMANPGRENPLQGEGIVLIDEIELHMHPSWQRSVLGILRRTFPNIQFIITTHSPQVLGEADDSYVVIKLNSTPENGIVPVEMSRMDLYDSNSILESYMDTSHINLEFQRKLDAAYSAIADNQFNAAEQIISEISTIDANHPEVIRLESAYKRTKYINEKNKQG